MEHLPNLESRSTLIFAAAYLYQDPRYVVEESWGALSGIRIGSPFGEVLVIIQLNSPPDPSMEN
jgi:hypothetical protein